MTHQTEETEAVSFARGFLYALAFSAVGWLIIVLVLVGLR